MQPQQQQQPAAALQPAEHHRHCCLLLVMLQVMLAWLRVQAWGTWCCVLRCVAGCRWW
jgi:hypothetical protein